MVIQEQIISLDNLRFYSYHGVEPQEEIVGAWYTVDLKLKVQVTRAILNDSLDSTVNYAHVTRLVAREMAIPSKLLEHVAGRIATALLDSFPLIESVTVTVCKQHPPIGTPCLKAGFTLTASK